MPKYNDDEIIARALQEEYDREMRRSEQNPTVSRSQRASPSAPPERTIRGRRLTETDEEYARRLAREEERLYQFYQQRQSQNTAMSSRSTTEEAHFSNGVPPPVALEATANAQSSGFFEVKRSDSDITPATSREGSTIFDDEEYARRIEQELHDEEIARRMQESDENRASRNIARQVALEPAPRYSFKCFCSWLIGATVAGAAIAAFFYFFYIKDNGSPRHWIWDPTEFADEDVRDLNRIISGYSAFLAYVLTRFFSVKFDSPLTLRDRKTLHLGVATGKV